MHRRQSYFSTYLCLFNCQRMNKKIIYANVYRNTINDGDSQTSSLPIFPEGVGTSVHRLRHLTYVDIIFKKEGSKKFNFWKDLFFALSANYLLQRHATHVCFHISISVIIHHQTPTGWKFYCAERKHQGILSSYLKRIIDKKELHDLFPKTSKKLNS